MILLDRRKTRFGTIEILKDAKRGALLYRVGGYHQSETDRHGVSLLYYIHALGGLLAQRAPKTVLIIGCAGGTLAATLAWRGVDVTAVDINPHAFAFARLYFGLPAQVDCRLADGYEFLLASRRKFDAIVVDAFHGEIIPEHLKSPAFFKAARARLGRGGVLLVNVHAATDRDDAPDRVAANMAKAFPNLKLLDRKGRRDRNVILMGGNLRGLRKPKLIERPATDLVYVVNGLRFMYFRKRRPPRP